MSYLEFQETWEKEIKDARKRVLIWERPFLPDIPDVDKLSEEVVVEEVRKLSPYIKRAKKRSLSWLNGLLKFVLTFIPIVLLFCIKGWPNNLVGTLIFGAFGLFWIAYACGLFWAHPWMLFLFPLVLIFSFFVTYFLLVVFFVFFVLPLRLFFVIFPEARLRAYLHWFYIKIPYNL